ncbi:hypothetical protein QBC32DRAFT_123542 [Pseudoneurospora amorphoporcata]|uniref:Uncharacterized protein n=1 Tax=Pseudoneurospora amorphoporcata TaxID=241081 RepID=A0AAN6NY36_9PEZI|nr:hypothetical protein QBC32DRAFT_123542 [Pseudoneurospora amorphoporcata]
MTILTKAGTVLRRTGGTTSIRMPVPMGVGTAYRYKSTSTTHVPFPAGINNTLQISRHIYEQEGLVPEEVTLSYAVSPAESALRSSAPHISHNPGQYQTRQFSVSSAGSVEGGNMRAAAVSDPSIWDWGDFSHTQPDHMVAAKPIMPGDEHYDPVTINDMPSHSEANVKADRSDIDPLDGFHGPLWTHRHYHQHHTQASGYQARHFVTASVTGMAAAALHDPSIWDWGDRSHTQPDHTIPARPILPGDPHYDPVTINDMPSQSEANVKADRSEIDPLPMGLHHVIPLPAGDAIPEPTESEWNVRADRCSMEEDPLRDRMSFRDYGPLMAAGRRTEKEIQRENSMKMKKGDNADTDTGDLYGNYGVAGSASDFSGGEMGEGMESTDKERSVKQDRLFMEDFGEKDESLEIRFGEGEGRKGRAMRRRHGMEDMLGMDKSAEEIELEDAMLQHFTR